MTERRTIVTIRSQTRVPRRARLAAEGGGNLHPTLGGGCGELRATPFADTSFGDTSLRGESR